MTKRVRWDRGASSTAVVRLGRTACLLFCLACARSGLLAGDLDPGEPDLAGGSSGTEAGKGASGFSGKGGGANAGASTGGAGGQSGFSGAGLIGGAGPVGGAGSGGSAGGSGNGGRGGSTDVAGGVVAAWVEDRWVVATPRSDSRALVLYEVSERAELLSGPREVVVEGADVPLTLFDAVSDLSGNIGIVGDRSYVTISAGFDVALMSASLGPSDCFVRRIEHMLGLDVLVSVRATLEGPITLLETPGLIDGNLGFHQRELTWIGNADCHSFGFAPWLNFEGRLGVDFAYPPSALGLAPLQGARLYDARKPGVEVGAVRMSPEPAPDFDTPTGLDLARNGTLSVASFRDKVQDGTRYLLIEEFAFTVVEDVVQGARLRLAAPIKPHADAGFVQAVVIDAPTPVLDLRELFTIDGQLRGETIANADVVAVHLAQGPVYALAVAFRVGSNSEGASHAPGLYLYLKSHDGYRFLTELPDF